MKPFARQFYDSKEWQNVRAYILRRDKYMCTICGDAKNLEVHHIIHLSPTNIGDPNITLNEHNLTTLCRDCHFKIHEEDKKRGQIEHSKKSDCSDGYEFDENGFIIVKK